MNKVLLTNFALVQIWNESLEARLLADTLSMMDDLIYDTPPLLQRLSGTVDQHLSPFTSPSKNTVCRLLHRCLCVNSSMTAGAVPCRYLNNDDRPLCVRTLVDVIAGKLVAKLNLLNGGHMRS